MRNFRKKYFLHLIVINIVHINIKVDFLKPHHA